MNKKINKHPCDIKYTKISVFINNKEMFFNNVDKVFSLALVDYPSGSILEYYGINIGISIRHKDENDEKEFYDCIFGKTNFRKDGFVIVYLYGYDKARDHRVIIPVIVAEANGYEKEMGTSCLFGYFSPEILAADDKPKRKAFGSIEKSMEYMEYV